VSFVNYLAELPYFVAELLPRLARLGCQNGLNPALNARLGVR
jgi:hypothetical protein